MWADITFEPDPDREVTPLYQAFLDRMGNGSDITEFLPLLYDAARSYPGARVLELGTRKGNSTLALLAGAEESGGHVWSCDITACDQDPDGMMPWRDDERWTFIKGDDMHPSVKAALPPVVDVLFIDTSHEYQHTLDEMEAYVPRVAPGGLALFHDTRFIFETIEEWDGHPPPVGQAIDDWCKKHGRKWVENPTHYGMGLLPC